MVGDLDELVLRRRYGVAEWFGNITANLAPLRLNELAAKSAQGPVDADMPCPFRQAADSQAKCNKRGGVCSLQIHAARLDGTVVGQAPFVTTCPSRFWQDNKVFQWVGQDMLGVAKPIIIKEVEFLEGLAGEEEEAGDAVGRIDTVLLDPGNPREWCAMELQAVYFSGAGMPSHLRQYADPAITGLVFPDANRRPDFRSSGPKRLMPQLQTKIPTLRRWGRKMAVVVDVPFFQRLGELTPISHLSNADIGWYVVDYDPASGAISLSHKVYTTLESSTEALTAGVPTSKDAFDATLADILTSTQRARQKKVIRLA